MSEAMSGITVIHPMMAGDLETAQDAHLDALDRLEQLLRQPHSREEWQQARDDCRRACDALGEQLTRKRVRQAEGR